MSDLETNRGSVNSGSVTNTGFSFSNTIGNNSNRSISGSNGRHTIKKQDVIDFDIELDNVENTAIDTEAVLKLGKGPLNSKFVENPTVFFIEKEQERLQKEKVIKYYTSIGFTPEDAERLANKEITEEALYDEIKTEFANGNGTRYKALLGANALSYYYFNRSESEAELEQQKQTLDMLSDENINITVEHYKGEIKLIQSVIDLAHYDEKTGLYYSVNSNNEEVTFNEKEFQELKQSLNTKKELLSSLVSNAEEKRTETENRIAALTKALNDPTKEEFTFTTMDEVESRIAELDKTIEGLGEINCRFVNGRYVVQIPKTIEVKQQDGVDDLISDGSLDGTILIGENRTREIIATNGTGSNIYVTDTKNNYTEHIRITMREGKYVEIIEHETSNGNCVTYERELPNQKVTITFEYDDGHKESFTTFSGSETLTNYYDQYWSGKVDVMPAIAEGVVKTKSGREVTVHIDTSDGEEFAGWAIKHSRDSLPKGQGHYEEKKYNYEDSVKAEIYNKAQDEKEKLLTIKNQVDRDVAEAMKLDWYRFQPDFKDQSRFLSPDERNEKLKQMMEEKIYDDTLPIFMSLNPVDYVYSHYAGDKKVSHFSMYRTDADIERERWENWTDSGAIEEYGKRTGEDLLPIYAYICNTQGFTKGSEFLEQYSDIFDALYLELQTKNDTQYANSGSDWERSLKNAWTLISNIGYSMDNSADIWTLRFSGKKIYGSDIYNPAETIHAAYRNSYYQSNGKVFGTVMDGIYSMDQMSLNFLLAYALGAGAGSASAGTGSISGGGSSLLGGPTVSSLFSISPAAIGSAAIVYGFPTFTSTYYDAKVNRNLSDDKALLLASATAVTEITMESFATSHLLGLDAMCENVIRSGITSRFADKLVGLGILKPEIANKTLAVVYCMVTQGCFEFNEEFETTILDYTWDKLITGDESRFNAKVENYKKLHNCSDEEAILNAILEINQEGVQAGEMAFVESMLFAGMTAGGGGNTVTNPLGVNYQVNTDIQVGQQVVDNNNINIEVVEDTDTQENNDTNQQVEEDSEIEEKAPVIQEQNTEVLGETEVQSNIGAGRMAVNEYIANIEEMQQKGISLQDYLAGKGIKTVQLNNNMEAALYLGDSKLYVLTLVENQFNDPKISKRKKQKIFNFLKKHKFTSVGDLNFQELLEDAKPFLSKSEIKIANDLHTNGMVERRARTATQAELNAIYNYTQCGGFELNAWLNDAPYGGFDQRARNFYASVAELQDHISGIELKGGAKNRVFLSSEVLITDALDSYIANTNYDEAIVAYRGIQHLYNDDVEIDPLTLKPGSEIHSNGYQSASIVKEECFAVRSKNQRTNIMLEIVVPPNSGSAAYIENVSGVYDYGQMEVLVKRDATLVVVGDVRVETINGVQKTIIPVTIKP